MTRFEYMTNKPKTVFLLMSVCAAGGPGGAMNMTYHHRFTNGRGGYNSNHSNGRVNGKEVH